MTDVFFYLFFAGCAAGLTAVVARPARAYEYPYAMTAVFAAFVGPQLFALSQHPDRVPAEAFEKVVFLATLCLTACWVGYGLGGSGALMRGLSSPLDPTRLFHGGVMFLAIGSVAAALMHREAAAGVRDQYGNFTGTVTIYHFFAQLLFPGFAIALSTALRTRSPAAVAAALYGLSEPLAAAIYAGRRESTVQIVLVFGLTLFFQRGVVPPRWLVAAAVAAAAVLIPVTDRYRMHAREHGLGALQMFDPFAEFENGVRSGASAEISMAAKAVHAADASDELGFGAGYWNHMVFRFVPAQLVGREVKEGLKLPAASLDLGWAYDANTPPGTTMTGIADTYIEFGYLGCGFFVVLGVWFRSLWAAAVQGGVLAQLLYMLVLTSAMRALTHWTYDFLPGLTFMAAVLVPVYFYARRKPGEQA